MRYWYMVPSLSDVPAGEESFMKNMTLQNIAAACGGNYFGPTEALQKQVAGISIDSRKTEKDWLFVATKGERVDGHSFISQVMENGAAAVISEKELADANFPYIVVEDSFIALKKIAAFYREQLDIKVVGITGSVGKTSTKEMIASVLSAKYKVQKTQKNFNNEVGLPLTVFSISDEHEIAVLEMGISDFGEMSRLTNIAKPDICVITNIGQCHLENLGDRDGVLKAKTEIFLGMKEDGEVVLNGEDDKLLTVKNVAGKPVHYFAKNKTEEAEVYATDIVNRGLLGTNCTIHTNKGEIDVHIHMPGEHMVNNALTATVVGLLCNLTLEEIRDGIEKAETLAGRSHIIETEKYVVIDDCYNANPVSMKAALDLLETANGRKVAILGSMFELGEMEEKLHYETGVYAAQKNIDVIVALGQLGAKIYEGAKVEGTKMVYRFETVEAFLQQKESVLEEKDTILVKASHGMHLEQIVDALK